MTQQWYVIHTLSGQEQKVRDALERRVVLDNLEDKVSQVLIPFEKVSEVKGGKKIIRPMAAHGFIAVIAVAPAACILQCCIWSML